MRRTCLAALLGAMLVASAHAQVYQWKDASGQIVFGDQPPAGVDARLVKAHPASGTKAATAPPDKASSSDEGAVPEPEMSKAEREAIEKREQERKEARARACQEARNHLSALESGQRVVRFNEKGEREFLDDQARIEQIERTRQMLRENCSN